MRYDIGCLQANTNETHVQIHGYENEIALCQQTASSPALIILFQFISLWIVFQACAFFSRSFISLSLNRNEQKHVLICKFFREIDIASDMIEIYDCTIIFFGKYPHWFAFSRRFGFLGDLLNLEIQSDNRFSYEFIIFPSATLKLITSWCLEFEWIIHIKCRFFNFTCHRPIGNVANPSPWKSVILRISLRIVDANGLLNGSNQLWRNLWAKISQRPRASLALTDFYHFTIEADALMFLGNSVIIRGVDKN